MTEAVNGVALLVEQLNERVRELESRVAALEAQPRKSTSAQPVSVAEALKYLPERPVGKRSLPKPVLEGTAFKNPQPPSTWRGFPPPDMPSGAVPVLGKAILGIAGAYL